MSAVTVILGETEQADLFTFGKCLLGRNRDVGGRFELLESNQDNALSVGKNGC